MTFQKFSRTGSTARAFVTPLFSLAAGAALLAVPSALSAEAGDNINETDGTDVPNYTTSSVHAGLSGAIPRFNGTPDFKAEVANSSSTTDREFQRLLLRLHPVSAAPSLFGGLRELFHDATGGGGWITAIASGDNDVSFAEGSPPLHTAPSPSSDPSLPAIGFHTTAVSLPSIPLPSSNPLPAFTSGSVPSTRGWASPNATTTTADATPAPNGNSGESFFFAKTTWSLPPTYHPVSTIPDQNKTNVASSLSTSATLPAILAISPTPAPTASSALVPAIVSPSELSSTQSVTSSASVDSSPPAAPATSVNIGYQFVPVGNPGNANDPLTGNLYGAVSYSYNIGQYDVTLNQYAAFLNAVAQLDQYSLYNASLATNSGVAGIQRSGANGSFSYSVIGDGNRPVTYITWFDAARFANWMQNGEPTGLGEDKGSTETGAYNLNGKMTGIFSKNTSALYWIPTESEWYKAAYYDPTLNGGAGGYWTDATMGLGVLGNTIGNQPHQANYFNGTYSTGGVGGYLTDVGAFGASSSFYNIFDGSGDVYQWDDAIVNGNSRVYRGGAWDSFSSFYLLSANRSFTDPTFSSADLGFRLATIPEPSPWVALASGAAVLLMWRRRRLR